MTFDIKKISIALSIVVAFAANGIAQTGQSTYPPKRQYNPPSQQYSPAKIPVSVRPQQDGMRKTTGSQYPPVTAGNTPPRMTSQQFQQFQSRASYGQQNAGGSTQSPPKIHRLSDATLPHLGVQTQSTPTANKIPFNSPIQKTSFNSEAVEQEDGEPVVPEILRGKKKTDSKKETKPLVVPKQLPQQPVTQPSNQFPSAKTGNSKTKPDYLNSTLPGTLPGNLPGNLPGTLPGTLPGKLPVANRGPARMPGKLPQLPPTTQQQFLQPQNLNVDSKPQQKVATDNQSFKTLPSLPTYRDPNELPPRTINSNPPPTQFGGKSDITESNMLPTRKIPNPDNPRSFPVAQQQDVTQSFPSQNVSSQTVGFEQPSVSNSSSSTAAATTQDRTINALQVPMIRIETLGPKTISKGKQSTYKIRITNHSKSTAERIALNFDLPKHVQIVNVTTSGGQRQISPNGELMAVQWNVAALRAGHSLTMSVDLIPNRAEAIDLNVKWRMEPKSTSSKIQVTEPKLAMTIAGPKDVQFGSKSMYTVTVKNIGTGLAENIKVRLSEALGGAQAPLGHIPAGDSKQFQVELSARSAGQLQLQASAVGSGDLRTAAAMDVMVRRAKLTVAMSAPKIKYAGTVAVYDIVVSNRGDAIAKNLNSAMNMPAGIKYLSGINGAKAQSGRLSWKIGDLTPGDERRYRIHCQMNAAGKVKVDLGVQGAKDLMAATSAITQVETIADLVLSVEDPKGPLPTGDLVAYTIRVKNRGSRSADNVNLVMHFSDGIEPTKAEGLGFRIAPGEVAFTPINSIEPGKEVIVKVMAKAFQAGNHTFRAQLKCDQSDSLEVSQGTTKFYGDSIRASNKPPARPVGNGTQFKSNQIPNGG